MRGSPKPSLNAMHRPFDLRFQSRLSSSSFGSPRSASPSLYLAHSHSRQSSFASQVSAGLAGPNEPPYPEFERERENAQDLWDVIRWTRLRKISGQTFSEVGRRNFGRPTCMAVSTSIVIGTSKGIILVFDYQQNLKSLIGPGSKGSSCPRSSVKHLC